MGTAHTPTGVRTKHQAMAEVVMGAQFLVESSPGQGQRFPGDSDIRRLSVTCVAGCFEWPHYLQFGVLLLILNHNNFFPLLANSDLDINLKNGNIFSQQESGRKVKSILSYVFVTVLLVIFVSLSSNVLNEPYKQTKYM